MKYIPGKGICLLGPVHHGPVFANMAATDKTVIVPSENPSSCFTRDDFMKDSFSVDSFITSHKGSVSLDTIKDDLEEYLKSLKAALIELINQDYADFVNLSTNLVSLRKISKY